MLLNKSFPLRSLLNELIKCYWQQLTTIVTEIFYGLTKIVLELNTFTLYLKYT